WDQPSGWPWTPQWVTHWAGTSFHRAARYAAADASTTRGAHRGRAGGRTRPPSEDALVSRIDVEPPFSCESYDRHALRASQLGGEARRSSYRHQHGHAGHARLLNQLEARASADDEDLGGEGNPSGEERRPDDLVDGVVPANVLPDEAHGARGVEEARAVE